VNLLGGGTLTGCSASVAALVSAMSRTLALGKLRLAAWLFLLSLGIAGALAGVGTNTDKEAPRPPFPPAHKAGAEDKVRLDLFGDPLPDGALARLGTIRFRNGSEVTAVTLSADGKTLVSANRTKVIRLWDLASGRPMGRIECPQIVYTVAIAPDGKLLAASGWGGPVYLLDRANGRVVRKLTNPHNKFNGVAFSRDGRFLAGGSNVADSVALWEVSSGKLVRELARVKQDSVSSWQGTQTLAFAPDGQTLATIFGNEIRLWDFQAGRLRHVLSKTTHTIEALAFAPRGNLLAAAGADRAVLVWDWQKGELVASLQADGHSNSGFSALAFAPSGKTLAVATPYLDNDHSVVRLWDLLDKQVVREISWKAEPLLNPVHNTGFRCLAFGAEHLLIGGDIRGMVRVWDLAAANVPASNGKGGWNVPSRCQDEGHDEPVRGIVASPDGKVAASAGDDATVRIWDPRTGKELKRLFTSRDARGLAFSPDGTLLGAVDQNDWLFLWETRGWQRVRLEKDLYARCLAFSPDAKTLAIGGMGYRAGKWAGGTVLLVERQTFREIRRFENISEQVLSLTFSADGRVLAAGASGERHNGPMAPGGMKFDPNVVHAWDVASGREIVQLGGSKLWVNGLALSQDSRSLVAVGHEEFLTSATPGALRLWEVATGQERARFEGHDNGGGPIRAAAFAPDGNLLASAGWFDPRIRLWDLNTGKQVHSFPGHAGPVTGLAFSADGKTLLSASEDSTGLVWRVPALPSAPTPLLKEAQWSDLWQTLAGTDAKAAFRAVQAMKQQPREAALFLRAHLTLPIRPDDGYLQRRLQDLNSTAFSRRARAERDLIAAGDWAVPALRKFLAGDTGLEERIRAKKILERIEGPEHWRVCRAMEILAHLKIPEARQVLETLARGAGELDLVREARRTPAGK